MLFRSVDALQPNPAAADALASLARRTDDPMRDLPPATREAVRQKLAALPNSERLLAVFEGEEERDERTLGRIFGEELPSGLVVVEGEAAG